MQTGQRLSSARFVIIISLNASFFTESSVGLRGCSESLLLARCSHVWSLQRSTHWAQTRHSLRLEPRSAMVMFGSFHFLGLDSSKHFPSRRADAKN